MEGCCAIISALEDEITSGNKKDRRKQEQEEHILRLGIVKERSGEKWHQETTRDISGKEVHLNKQHTIQEESGHGQTQISITEDRNMGRHTENKWGQEHDDEQRDNLNMGEP